MTAAHTPHPAHTPPPAQWSPDSWKAKLLPHQFVYEDRDAVERAVAKLRAFPPLVTSGMVERLREEIAEAQQGRRFLLQGGDCAESLADCRADLITGKLKILMQMSLILAQGLRKPIIRVGRIAGQYTKPRSSKTETRNGISLPSYFGDLVNNPEFTPEARRPDPHLMVRGYQHAAVTLNFIRSLIESGFADIHHPERWDLSFMDHASVTPDLRADYARAVASVTESLRFMESITDRPLAEIARIEFFTSHEGLNLHYESAQTRTVPRRDGHYNLTTHFPWIGERSRAIDGAHTEYFRGIRNPIAIKVSASANPADIVNLLDVLDPAREPGRITLITRMGARSIREKLPPLIHAIARAKRTVLWVADPMHANTVSTSAGIKTRRFEDILEEVRGAFDAHDQAGSILGGVHFELTGENVTECTGGGAGITDADLTTNYISPCDPRLNYGQALELAFLIARRAAHT